MMGKEDMDIKIPDKVVEEAGSFIREFFKDNSDGHDYWHSIRVFNMAKELAKREDANLKLVCLAALLHDVDDAKLSPETHEKKENASEFMNQQGLEEEAIEKVCDIISRVSFRADETEKASDIETACVQDADRLDAMGAIGIARIFAYGGRAGREIYDPAVLPRESMTAEEYVNTPGTSVNHFYEKIFRLKDYMNTDTAKELALEREAYMKEYLERFYSEWSGII